MAERQIKKHAKYLRTNQTECEQKLWKHLRAKRFENRKFYRQFVIGPYIVDFIQRQAKVIIELDGGQHNENKQYDDDRTQYLEKLGYQVIRYWNNDVIENIEGVLSDISDALASKE